MRPDIVDPRAFAAVLDPVYAPLIESAQASLEASSTARAAELDSALSQAMSRWLQARDSVSLAACLDCAPSAAIARHLWRQLIAAWDQSRRNAKGDGLAGVLFALPLVIIAGRQSGDVVIAPGVLRDTSRISALLRKHGALGGNETFALANALVGVDALDVPRLPDLFAWQQLVTDGPIMPLDLVPAPIAVAAGHETVHLRFVVGTGLVAPDANVFDDPVVGAWGLPLARELAQQLEVAEVSLLPLPAAPLPPPSAVQQGRARQREVAAQLFASNAIRRFRASVGEPSAVISAHRVNDAIGGGELRLSLSSALDSHHPEAFRCPLFPTDRANDVAGMLIELLQDCHVTDIQVLPGIHADCDKGPDAPLLFRADALAALDRAARH